ncbi:hypothetical protein RvY_07145-1 [Ramazzottius varieornatus]|uniref:Uncharacterized protein n=1 Tax=Ramazzottius varieornatus TaxID=947166 RepID=A0A1D1V115_RAMVA|nr:hypothetical protein RvY_07145-1 [Ramazzottius varieornatus]
MSRTQVEACLISTETSKITLPELMLRLLTDLNNLGRCSVELNKSSTLFLKVVPANRNKSAAVHDFDVPILASNFTSLAALEDLTTRQIVPLIDGVKNVHQISDEVDADPDLVKSCVQNMIFYNVCKVVPAFHLTNVYRVMPGIERLIFNGTLQRECLKTVTKAENDAPSIRDIMVLYGDMQIGITVKNLLARHTTIANKIDEKKFCDFGVMHGLISRVYKYPLYTRYNQTTVKANTTLRWFNGAHHTDDILQRIEPALTIADLDDRIEADHSVVVCWK